MAAKSAVEENDVTTIEGQDGQQQQQVEGPAGQSEINQVR
jgi:hypothetical protein